MKARLAKRRRDPVRQLMLDAVREDVRSESGYRGAAVDTDRLVAAVDYHRIAGYVLMAFEGRGLLGEGCEAKLWALHQLGLDRQRRALEDLRRVRSALNAVAVPWLVVKGPVLAEAVHSRPTLRIYNDLDIVIVAADLPRAIAALEDVGYHVFDRNWSLIRKLMAGEVHLAYAPGAGVDLHWHLLFSERLRQQFPIPMHDLMSRARTVLVEDIPTSTLEPSDSLIHLCLNAGLEGGDRLLWLKDIERATVNDSPDWDAVVRRSHAWSVHLVVGTMLSRVRVTLDAPVPDEVVSALLPFGWRKAMDLAQQLFPPEASTGIGSPATLPLRAARSTAPATVAAIAAGFSRRLAYGLRTQTMARRDIRRRHDRPGSLLYPAGDDSDRAAFIEAVRDGRDGSD